MNKIITQTFLHSFDSLKKIYSFRIVAHHELGFNPVVSGFFERVHFALTESLTKFPRTLYVVHSVVVSPPDSQS